MRGTIEIAGLSVFAHHGVTEAEKLNGQRFVIDLSFEVDIAEAAKTDKLGLAVKEVTAEQKKTSRFLAGLLLFALVCLGALRLGLGLAFILGFAPQLSQIGLHAKAANLHLGRAFVLVDRQNLAAQANRAHQHGIAGLKRAR